MPSLTTEERDLINEISLKFAELEVSIREISEKTITPGDRNMINSFISDTSKTLSEMETKFNDISTMVISPTELAELKALKPILIVIMNQQKDILKKLNS